MFDLKDFLSLFMEQEQPPSMPNRDKASRAPREFAGQGPTFRNQSQGLGGGAGNSRQDLAVLLNNAGSLVPSLKDPRLQIIELMKDAHKSAYGAESQRSSGERQSAALEHGRLARLLDGDGSLAANRSRGFINPGIRGVAFGGLNTSALSQMRGMRDEARSEKAYKQNEMMKMIDRDRARNSLEAEKYQLFSTKEKDDFRQNLIMELLRRMG